MINTLSQLENELNDCNCKNEMDISNLIYFSLLNMDSCQSMIGRACKNYSGLTDEILDIYRKKHLKLIGNTLNQSTNHQHDHLMDQQLQKLNNIHSNIWTQFSQFTLKDLLYLVFISSKSIGSDLLSSSIFLCSGGMQPLNHNSIKSKNILRSELLLNFRDSINKIIHHFKLHSSKSNLVDYEKDVSKNQTSSQAVQLKRCLAIEDYEAQALDELSFTKSQIIELVDQNNKHGYIGQINKKRGWFPSKCVKLLDERTKQFEMCGDDSLDENIGCLVKKEFFNNFMKILKCGTRNLLFLPKEHQHPWFTFKEIVKDYDTQKISLAESFRLEEDIKVLSSIEKLKQIIHRVEEHTINWSLDSKLCLIVCYALNEQILHEWTETMCNNKLLLENRYHDNAFLRSPVWIQIYSELKNLSSLPFNLCIDIDAITNTLEHKQRHFIRETLIEQHLFNWNM